MIYGSVEGVFRSIVNAGWGVQSAGSVMFPVGYFSVVEIPEHEGERAEMREAVFSEDAEEAAVFDTVKAGWYFVVQKDDGSIVADECKNRDYAFARYNLTDAAYTDWVTND